VAACHKAWNVCSRSNPVIVGSNPTRCMNVCLRLFCIYVVMSRQRPSMGLIPVQGVLPTIYKIKISELFLNGNRPESLIHRGGRRRISFISFRSFRIIFLKKRECYNPALTQFNGTQQLWNGKTLTQASVEVKSTPNAHNAMKTDFRIVEGWMLEDVAIAVRYSSHDLICTYKCWA
jgi:hypothetical protein